MNRPFTSEVRKSSNSVATPAPVGMRKNTMGMSMTGTTRFQKLPRLVSSRKRFHTFPGMGRDLR